MSRQFSSILSVAIFVMLISFITSCGDDDGLISGDYLPIEVGNSWSFINVEDPEDPDSISIIGTTKLSNGKTVFIAETLNTSNRNREKGYLSRAADGFLLFHQAIDDLHGELIYSPPIKVGTTWQGSEGKAEVVAQETVNTAAGVFQNCFRLNLSIDRYNNSYFSIWLARNVGPVKFSVFDASDGELEDTAILEKFNVR